MDVFGYGTDEASRPLLSPAICFICENSPTQEAQKVIDTTREFNPECLTRLSGRKYICGACAEELGKAVGMVSASKYADEVDAVQSWRDSAAHLTVELEQARAQQHAVVDPDSLSNQFIDSVRDTIRDELAKQAVKPVKTTVNLTAKTSPKLVKPDG